MKCARCGREVPQDESYSYHDQTLCEDCYIDAISPEKKCDPWATYVSSQSRQQAGVKDTETTLTEMQRKIHEFIRSQSRVTREEVMAKFNLNARDLAPQLHVLMHAELVKERSEGGIMYLIPLPVSS